MEPNDDAVDGGVALRLVVPLERAIREVDLNVQPLPQRPATRLNPKGIHMNMKYARFVNGQLTYAPSIIVTKRGDTILNPKRLSYLQASYKQLVDEPPTPPRGKSAALSRYDETSDPITVVYKLAPVATAPRTFSKLRLVAALDSQCLWSAFRDWMVEQEYYDLFLAAQEFREYHPSFTEVLNAAKSRFNLTDDQCAALLDAAVVDA